MGEILESNSAANLLIRGVAYGGSPEYVSSYNAKIAELHSELKMLADIEPEYTLDAAGQNATAHLEALEQEIIYQRTVMDNQTAALQILKSEEYNETLHYVNSTIYALGDEVVNDSNNESNVISTCAIVGMVVAVVALLYTLPSTIYLMYYERRHTKQMMRLTRLLDSALKENEKRASSSSSAKGAVPDL